MQLKRNSRRQSLTSKERNGIDKKANNIDDTAINTPILNGHEINEFEVNQQYLDEEKSHENLMASCGCTDEEHAGKEVLNLTFKMSVDYLYECIVNHNEWTKNFQKRRKIFDHKKTDWKIEVINGKEVRTREIDYKIEFTELFGYKHANNLEYEKILKHIPGELYVIEYDSYSSGPPLSDTFKFKNRYCLTRCTANTSKLLVHALFSYRQKPSLFLKPLIEKVSMGGLIEYYTDLAKSLTEESDRLSHLNFIEASTASLISTISNSEESASSNIPVSSSSITGLSENEECNCVDKRNEINEHASTEKGQISNNKVTQKNESLISSEDESKNTNLSSNQITEKYNVSLQSTSINSQYEIEKNKHQSTTTTASIVNRSYSRQSSSYKIGIASATATKSLNNSSSNLSTNKNLKSDFVFKSNLTKHSKNASDTSLLLYQSNKPYSFIRSKDTNFVEFFLYFILFVMFFLVGFNFILYYKLNEIQNIANIIKKHPKYADIKFN